MKIDFLMFDGAGNVQKAKRLMQQKNMRIAVIHGPVHFHSLIFDNTIKLSL